MNYLLKLCVFLVFLSFISCTSLKVDLSLRSTLVYTDQQEQSIAIHPDKIQETKETSGDFLSVEWGDYLHLNFKLKSGENFSLFATDDRITYFILAHKIQTLNLKYQIVEAWIPEGGGYYKINRIISAKTDSIDFFEWWHQECRKRSESDVVKQYENLLQTTYP